MTAYSIPVLLLAAGLGYWLFRVLRSGEAPGRGVTHTRTDDPLGYWFVVAMMAAIIVTFTTAALGLLP